MSVNDHISIMFVDDDEVTGSVMQRNCDSARYNCTIFDNAEACLEAFRDNPVDLVITDLRMPGMNGFDLLSKLREVDEELPVLVMTGYSSVENAVEAMKRGATDFIKKPFDFQELKLMIERTFQSVKLKNENRLLKRRISDNKHRFGMIGDTAVMRSLFSTIEKVAEVSCCVVVSGESGTGKELIARALHDYSPRSDAPFVAIDCGALSDTLLESELFGHEKGAFTGATQRKTGLMEQASGGTLFLDEICNISDNMQIKLMRAIEQKQIIRVGGTTPIPIDLRVVAASNQDLQSMVEQGRLRHDFYHRLNVVNLHAPSLKERRDDIPALVEHFVHVFSATYNREVTGFDQVSKKRLCAAEWKGNIRELKNTIERCVILADGPVLQWSGAGDALALSSLPVRFSEQEFVSLLELEQEYINHVLRCCEGRKTHAAKLLGIDKTTLWRKLRRYESQNEWV